VTCADCKGPFRTFRYRFGDVYVCGRCAIFRMKKGERAK